MIDKIINKLKDKNVAILGFGMEGKSTYLFLRKYLKNQLLTIIDKNDIRNDALLKDDKNLSFKIGDDYLENLDSYDFIIKTPGISLKNIDIKGLRSKITSQLELILEVDKKNVIGITGTKGKSTTSSLIYQVIKNNNVDTYLLGNIGKPVFDVIEKFKENTILVIEMSSHQLEFVNVSPHIGIILNLFQDHLDHAGSVEHYHECKLNMFRYMVDDDIAIYCQDNEILNKKVNNLNICSKKISVSLNENADVHIKDNFVVYNNKNLYDINSPRKLMGTHNLENIMTVLTVSELLNLDLEKSIEAINEFATLEHRLELVGTFDDIIYYNDAIATIPEATMNAIETLKNVNTLIFGGMDRGISYEAFIKYLDNCSVENLICMPSTGHTIGKRLKNKKVHLVQTLDEAVDLAKKITKKNMICLLSPAASSYEYFKNFEEKGNYYKKLVTKN